MDNPQLPPQTDKITIAPLSKDGVFALIEIDRLDPVFDSIITKLNEVIAVINVAVPFEERTRQGLHLMEGRVPGIEEHLQAIIVLMQTSLEMSDKEMMDAFKGAIDKVRTAKAKLMALEAAKPTS